ncbi:Rha family transcriptional regulator [Pseudomonas avellanae]|uniref:Rha family transcriptional regulator n=2 Tax=Pseudomonas avellanae TaxID=46257 RepID=UPI0009E3BAC1|nr:Rha family transcriptional regulator [Pseudomonas avellanae]
MHQMISSNQQTMSSREIADLVGLRHDNVKRTIESLAKSEVIQLPQIEEVKNHRRQTVTAYRIGKRDSFVVVAQLSPEFPGPRRAHMHAQARRPRGRESLLLMGDRLA